MTQSSEDYYVLLRRPEALSSTLNVIPSLLEMLDHLASMRFIAHLEHQLEPDLPQGCEPHSAAVSAEGGSTLWLDLHSYGSEQRLVEKLFRSTEFASWLQGDHRLHLFLDSLDECLLRVDTVAALLVDELRDYPVERLSLRVGCRTADWPGVLEEGLEELWGEEGFGAYELAPLRRTDVAAAAVANGIDPDSFLGVVDEAEAVPLAIKPVARAGGRQRQLAPECR